MSIHDWSPHTVLLVRSHCKVTGLFCHFGLKLNHEFYDSNYITSGIGMVLQSMVSIFNKEINELVQVRILAGQKSPDS